MSTVSTVLLARRPRALLRVASWPAGASLRCTAPDCATGVPSPPVLVQTWAIVACRMVRAAAVLSAAPPARCATGGSPAVLHAASSACSFRHVARCESRAQPPPPPWRAHAAHPPAPAPAGNTPAICYARAQLRHSTGPAADGHWAHADATAFALCSAAECGSRLGAVARESVCADRRVHGAHLSGHARGVGGCCRWHGMCVAPPHSAVKR